MISDLWKFSIDGAAAATAGALGIDSAVVTYRNLAADTLVLTESLPARVATPAAILPAGATVRLLRDGVTWFVGTVRERPTVLNRSRRTVVHGAWSLLERKPYLQDFAAPADPNDPDSELVTVQHGRVVLGQADDGLKVSVGAFISSVLTYAGVTPDVAGLDDVTIPFEDATGYRCSEVLIRCLRLIPDAVLWWDYTTTPPAARLRRRADLPATTISAADRRVQGIELTPRDDLVVNAVAIFYLATNRANDAMWETVTADVYPPGTTGAELDALTTTVQLSGSQVTSTYLTQRVETDPIPSQLVFGGLVTEASNPTTWPILRNWWREHVPALASGYVTIKEFESGARTKVDGSPVTAGLRELVAGGLTDWMIEDDADLVIERQVARVTIIYEMTEPSNALLKSSARAEFTAEIVATNAQTKTYTQLAGLSVVAAEEVPEGLAEVIYDAMHPLQYEGAIQLGEAEATAWPSVGAVVNVSGDLDAYTAMRALVRERSVDIGAGETRIVVGPPPALSASGLVEIFRNMRTRTPSVGRLVRATGRTGGVAGALSASLPVVQPAQPSSSAVQRPPRVFAQALTVAGTVPAAVEVTTALQAAYAAAGLFPVQGDEVELTYSGSVRLRSTVRAQGTISGIWLVSFAVGGVTYYAAQVQTGTW